MKAMDLIPYEVWRQRSYFDMESMLLVDVPTQQWMDEFYQVGGRGVWRRCSYFGMESMLWTCTPTGMFHTSPHRF